jgi:hypothetical protein
MMYIVAKLLMHWQVNFNPLKANSNLNYAFISRLFAAQETRRLGHKYQS